MGVNEYLSDIEAGDYISDRILSVSGVSNLSLAEKASEGIWVTRQGEALLIKDMTESHIRNCICMLESKPHSEVREAYLEALKDELRKRSKNIGRK